VGISVVVITKNEEAKIVRCLDNLRWADEIVVVDSESTDRTVEIARSYTDNVHVEPFVGFGAAWNSAISYATQEWVCIVASDEVITESLANEIRAAVASGDAIVGYCVPRLTYYMEKPIWHSGWYPDYTLRVFLKAKGRVVPVTVHEHAEVDGKTGYLKQHILHYSYPTIGEHITKIARYSELLAEQMHDRGRKARLYQLVTYPMGGLLKKYILQQGFRDGGAGLVIAAMHSYYVFLKYARLWELQQRTASTCQGEDPGGGC
jgi:glycosyltransferase involved in cell wall biosynthesis